MKWLRQYLTASVRSLLSQGQKPDFQQSQLSTPLIQPITQKAKKQPFGQQPYARLVTCTASLPYKPQTQIMLSHKFGIADNC